MTDSVSSTSKATLIFAGEKYSAFMMTSISKYEAKFQFINHKMETTYSFVLSKAYFKDYKFYDGDYVYSSILNNTSYNSENSIKCAFLFLILLLLIYFIFIKSTPKKSLLLMVETKRTNYVSVMKHDNTGLEI